MEAAFNAETIRTVAIVALISIVTFVIMFVPTSITWKKLTDTYFDRYLIWRDGRHEDVYWVISCIVGISVYVVSLAAGYLFCKFAFAFFFGT